MTKNKKRRKCLWCNKMFISFSATNRKCKNCKKK